MKLPIAIAAFSVFTKVSSSSVDEQARGVSYLFTFGDSYTRTGWSPTENWPTKDNPMGVATPDKTSSGGLNWVGFLTLMMNSSSIWLYNFSQSGAVVNKAWIPESNPQPLDLVEQTDSFIATVGKKPKLAPWNSHNGYAAIWIGGNDLSPKSSLNDSALHAKLAVNTIQQCDRLYRAGIRNFIILSFAPTYLLPRFYYPESNVYQQRVTANENVNRHLKQEAKAFGKRHRDVTYKFVDTYEPFMAAFQNPAAFGATDSHCYGDKTQHCLWWNNYHPGVEVQKFVAVDVVKTWNNAPFRCPASIKFCTNPPTLARM